MPEAVYQQGHNWFNQKETNYGPPETGKDVDYQRWAMANMVLLHLRGLSDLDPDAVNRSDTTLAGQADTIRGNIMMEVPGGWPSLFSCVDYILKSDNLNLSDDGKKGVRSAFETLIKLHPEYEASKEGFSELLGVLDIECPEYSRQKSS